ncbi:MAG TPA: proton-conducting transporter membrane subunit, partial [Myxococcota bacterium]|nr:proton-conducting transporter membrane subunit [Myxococcota bacterium]
MSARPHAAAMHRPAGAPALALGACVALALGLGLGLGPSASRAAAADGTAAPPTAFATGAAFAPGAAFATGAAFAPGGTAASGAPGAPGTAWRPAAPPPGLRRPGMAPGSAMPGMRAAPGSGRPTVPPGLVPAPAGPRIPTVLIAYTEGVAEDIAAAKVEEALSRSKVARPLIVAATAERRAPLARCAEAGAASAAGGAATGTSAAAGASAGAGAGAAATGGASAAGAATAAANGPPPDPRAALVHCLATTSTLLTDRPGLEPDKIFWLEVTSARAAGERTWSVSAILVDRASGGVDRWAESTVVVKAAAAAADAAGNTAVPPSGGEPDEAHGTAAGGADGAPAGAADEGALPGSTAAQIAIQAAADDAAAKTLGALASMDLLDALPLLLLVLVALLVLLSDAFVRAGDSRYAVYVSLAGLAGVVWLTMARWGYDGAPGARWLFGGLATGGPMIVLDRFALYFNLVLAAGAALGVLLVHGYYRVHGSDRGERYALLLLSVTGMMILASATDLVTIFLGIETMSLAVYVLVASNRAQKESAEAGMKYFLIGAVASGILVYAIALLYGGTGTTNLVAMASAVQGNPALLHDPFVVAGVFLAVAGLGFKVAAVPFHAWVPDAYQGAPTPITGFMSVAVKAAAFAAFARVLVIGFGALHGLTETTGAAATAAAAAAAEGLSGALAAARVHGWFGPLRLMAVLTMILGNVAAIPQRNVKRMLAYSGIAHAGYLLVG